jgi:hypothetical protein
MRALSILGTIGLILVVIGAVNWGLVGLFDVDLVEEIFGTSTGADVVYVLVGIGGILSLGLIPAAFRTVSRVGGGAGAAAVTGAIALIVAIIGALNWGLIGLFDYNLVEAIFGTGTATDVVYIIVGVAGVLSLLSLFGLFGLRGARGERYARHDDMRDDRDDYRRAA